MEIDLSNPAASGSGEGESLVGRMKADRGPERRPRKVASGAVATHIQAQAAFETGLASPLVEAAEPESRFPRPLRSRSASTRPACSRSRRCASWPRTSASTSPRWPTARRPVTREDVETVALGGVYGGVYLEEVESGPRPIEG